MQLQEYSRLQPLGRGRWATLLSFFVICLSVFSSLLWRGARVDAAPLAQEVLDLAPDEVTTPEDTAITIDVLANDILLDEEGTLVIVAVGEPASGTAEIVDNRVVYTPNADFSGEDIFFYSVHNGETANTRQTTVRVLVEEVPDGPTDILISQDTVREDAGIGRVIGRFSTIQDGSALPKRGRDRPRYRLVGEDNDNRFFRIRNRSLRLRETLDFETQETYIVEVQARNVRGQTVTKRLTITVTDANDAPHDIDLSNDRLDENQPAGVTVGTLSTEDVDAGNSHTYALLEGTGSVDNDKFRIEGDALVTNALLDFERKPIYSIRIASLDNGGASFEEIFLINVNNIPSPPDATENGLESCSGEPITLVQEGTGNTQVLVEISDIVISELSLTGCRVEGKLSITSNGSSVNNLDFSGVVNERDQFSSTSIPDFTINMAGLPLEAKGVEISYNNEQPALHILRPTLRMPDEFGGLTADIAVPTFINTGGIRIGNGTIDLPTMQTESGFEMSLSGELVRSGDGFQIVADGSLTIPNIGKKKASDREGQECEISAGVTIFLDPLNRTVMEIKAGDELVQQPFGPFPMGPLEEDAMPRATAADNAFEVFRLDAVRAGFNCSPGLAIGTTGLFLTGLSGEITLIPGEERVDVTVNIQAAKELPGIGPILELEGSMGLQPSPFELDLGVALSVLSVEVARAEASITSNRFHASIRFEAIFFNGSAEINAFTRNGRFTFTGSARVSLEVKKGSVVKSGRCGRFLLRRVRLCPPALPPFNLGPLASAGVDVGEFTNGRFGFKGFVKLSIFGTHGFFVDDRGRFSFRNVNRFKLVSAERIIAARSEYGSALEDGDVRRINAVNAEFQFLEDVNDVVGQDGVIVSAPLTKLPVDEAQLTRSIHGPTDVITQVNLVQHGDVIFTMAADNPDLVFTLITPDGQEVTPQNVGQDELLGYTIAHLDRAELERVTLIDTDTDINSESDAFVPPLFRFTPLAADDALNGVDLQIDGEIVYYDIDFPNSIEWLTQLPLSAGDHLVELIEHGSDTVLRSTTVTITPESETSLIHVGGSSPELLVLADDHSVPSTFGKSQVRFFNGNDRALTLLIDGAAVGNSVAYKGVSDYVEIDAGTRSIALRNTSNLIVAELLATDLAEGGVYTVMSSDGSSPTIVQREDALYQPTFVTYYSVDQAVMNENWQMKVVGDTDNSFFDLAVLGIDAPPVLGSVTVDANDLAETNVSWQLTSDTRPTTVSVYVNPGEISASVPLTLTDGTVNTEEIPLYEGMWVAEYEITDLNKLGGQLVTKQIDLSDLPSGSYHLWIRADDGVNPAVETYAQLPVVSRAGTPSVYGRNAVRVTEDSFRALDQVENAAEIVVDHSNDFPTTWTATISNSFDAETRDLYIEWHAHSHPDTDLYRLLVGETSMNPTQVITAGTSIQEFNTDGSPTGRSVGFETLHDIRPGQTYYLAIEGVDTDSGRSVRSQEFTFIVDAGDFSISSAQAAVQIGAGQSATVPVTLNADEALFYPNVWLSTDLGAAPPGITARFVDDVDGLTTINPANPTHQLEISVDGSVPFGTYPIEIAGYNGSAEENLVIQVTVAADSGQQTRPIFMPFILNGDS